MIARERNHIASVRTPRESDNSSESDITERIDNLRNDIHNARCSLFSAGP
jgi:hypothetical protein